MFYKFNFDTVDLEIIHDALKLYFATLNDNDNPIERNRIRGLCETIASLEPPNEYLDMTFSEASKLWGLSDSTLRKAKHDGRFEDGEIRQSGGVWLVTRKAMERLYGELKSPRE